MFPPKQLEDLVKKLCETLPSGFQSFESDLRQQFKEILQSAFTHLDLVTREEFDVQVKVLARTREKVEHLQTQVDNLLESL